MANETKVKKNRVNFRQFFKEVSGEVKKLSWPTKKELVSYTLTVLGFIVLMAVIIYVLDLVFGEGLGLLANL
ncbi:MAG: preprotein translocase subunit SecE [Clostridia bacterium]|nr:preprotein translocase subunit SecE [Clostridia bacterium]